MTVRSILFDMDGLLIDSEVLSREIIEGLIAEAGFSMSDEQYTHLIGKNLSVGAQYMRALYGSIDTDRIYREYGRRYFEAVDAGRLRAKPGAGALLDECDRRGIRKAVASSNLKECVYTCLGRLHMLERMDVLVHDGMGAKGKPAPDLFLLAAQLLGERPQDCLVLEDSHAGIEAAHAAGIPAILVPDLVPPTPEILALCAAQKKDLFGVIDFLRENA